MKKLKTYASYDAALQAERDRERQWRATRQGKFESDMVRFEEAKEAFIPLAEVCAPVRRAADYDPEKVRRARKSSCWRVTRNIPECLQVLKLVFKNGNNKPKSVWEMVDDIKSQGGALKKEHSTTPCKCATSATSPKSATSTGLNTSRKRKTKRRRKRRNLPHMKKK